MTEVAAPPVPGAPLRLFYRTEDGTTYTDLALSELTEVVRERRGNLWLDVDLRDRHQHAVLEQVFHFHPLAIEDTLNPESRVKLDEYPDFLFAIIRGVRFEEATEDPYDLETYNLNFFLGTNYVVTVRAARSEACDRMAGALRANPDVLEWGAARLMHEIMDAAVDNYFPLVDRLDEFQESLERRVFERFDEGVLQEVFAVKRTVLALRRHLVPQREVFNVLGNRPSRFVPPATQLYFRDIYDHVLRLTETLDLNRELLSSTLDGYMSQVSNRLGTVTKTLSVFAAFTTPFVVVSGMWGMNFAHIPLSGSPQGFAILIAIQLGIGLALLFVLRWLRFI